MTSQDREFFARRLRELAEAFGRQISDNAVRGFWTALERLSAMEFGDACDAALTDLDRMPVPAQLLALARRRKSTPTQEPSPMTATAWTRYQRWEASRLRDLGVKTWNAFTERERAAWTKAREHEWACMSPEQQRAAFGYDPREEFRAMAYPPLTLVREPGQEG